MKNEKTFLPPNLGLAPFCKSRGMTLQIAQLQQRCLVLPSSILSAAFCEYIKTVFLLGRNTDPA